MRKIVTHLITCAFLTCLCLSAAVALDDFEDGDHDEAWFIANGGKTYKLRRLDSDGKYRESIVYSITVNSNYKPNHACDNDGTNYPHVHYGADYDDLFFLTEGNYYWDYMFQAPKHTTHLTNATNAYNCYAYALADFIDKSTPGRFSCWIDSPYACAAFNADADSTAKVNVQPCDVLLYGKAIPQPPPNPPIIVLFHATGVDNTDPVAKKPNALQWKYAASGLYYMGRTTFETPMCDDVTHTVGQPLGGNWDWDEAGDESNLLPKDEVWTPEP